MTVAGLVLAATLGAAGGSFLGVVVHRVPLGLGLGGRSACDRCGATLRARDLVPILSWVMNRGRCRTCGAPVTWRWSALELATALLAVAAASAFRDLASAVVVSVFSGVLLALALIDLRTGRLPNAIVYPLGLAGLLAVAVGAATGVPFSVPGAAWGAAGMGGALLLISVASRGGMGMGDAKLGAVIGLVVGAIDLRSVAVAGGVAVLAGGVVAIVALLRGATRKTAVPFGPMLAFGALVALFWGPDLADAYLRLLR